MKQRLQRVLIIVVMCVFLSVSAYSTTEVYFTHSDDIQSIILARIVGAEESIDIAMYTFTDHVLARALIEVQEYKGVKVRVYLDRSQVTAKYGEARYLLQGGIEIRISSNSAIMHNKFAIIDDELLLTGSYNWTLSANLRNDENMLIITNCSVVKEYEEQFEKLWEQNSPTLLEKLIERSK